MIVLAIWISGAIVSAGLMLSAQARFFDQARRGVAGPAVVGVIIGRLVMPADSADRWSIEERAAIRDHERAHLERGDLRVNALAALLQCLFWWNPFAHLGITWFRFDQELACDAAVMAQRPGRRRLYAEALLKAVPTAPLAFGCGWTTAGVGALATRLDSLRLPRHTPDMKDRLTILAFALTTATVAWAVQPASAERQRLKPTPVLNLRLLPPAPPDAS
ncbi:hypothetical protein GCM10017620_09080 [Brevundimonas intermedia]|uniref:Peptidase M56 domain-containing protein n=2 Tax=Brevundimonas intermedia TaxID=74315 RepID=A0ABQ5T593_9CAUL|nr:hypothetical protein GCM10017620_09080 [Brevundimonas intermedia]